MDVTMNVTASVQGLVTAMERLHRDGLLQSSALDEFRHACDDLEARFVASMTAVERSRYASMRLAGLPVLQALKVIADERG